MKVGHQDVAAALRGASGAAEVFRLPFRRELWRGTLGNWAGAGIGTSTDFQDHRAYVPGDDPRYIDWQAYGRSEHYVMKLYREEVSPGVDVVFDASSSMEVEPAKKLRSLELFYFVLESASLSGSTVRVFVLGPDGVSACGLESVQHPSTFACGGGVANPADVRTAEFRPGSLRVFISDCLFPQEPDPLVLSLVSRKGRAVVLAPFASVESAPDWSRGAGHVELEDCETGARRMEVVGSSRLETYLAAYRRHFQVWETCCRRRDVPFARISAGPALEEALRDAVGTLAVEVCA